MSLIGCENHLWVIVGTTEKCMSCGRWRQDVEQNWWNHTPQVATEESISRWNAANAIRKEIFSCNLCDYVFQDGDYWRYVRVDPQITPYTRPNIFVCIWCDGDIEELRKQWRYKLSLKLGIAVKK